MKRFEVTERLVCLRVKWVACCFSDRATGRALFMKKKSQPTNSEEHGGGGLLAPMVPVGKISDSIAFMRQ